MKNTSNVHIIASNKVGNKAEKPWMVIAPGQDFYEPTQCKSVIADGVQFRPANGTETYEFGCTTIAVTDTTPIIDEDGSEDTSCLTRLSFNGHWFFPFGGSERYRDATEGVRKLVLSENGHMHAAL